MSRPVDVGIAGETAREKKQRERKTNEIAVNEKKGRSHCIRFIDQRKSECNILW